MIKSIRIDGGAGCLAANEFWRVFSKIKTLNGFDSAMCQLKALKTPPHFLGTPPPPKT